MRAKHQVAGRSRQAGRERVAEKRAAAQQVAPGIQPYTADGALVCLESGCGRGYANLGQHLRQAHYLHADDYRRRHGLPAQLPLVTAASRERHRQASAKHHAIAAARSAALRAAAARQRYDDQARECGYDNVGALLREVRASRDIAALLGVSTKQAAKLRSRYG